MELKYFAILSLLGVAAALTIPNTENTEEHGESPGNLESSFSSGEPVLPGQESDSSSDLARDKRGLLFKKQKKLSGSDTYVVNHRYEGSTGYDEYRPNREVHHHHHYPYNQPQVVEHTYQPYPAPNQEYHHYHGASAYQNQQGYASGGSAYYSGAYAGGSSGYSRPNYGDGGYAQQAPQQQAPISASPLASGHNTVDRGQGAAAVNNIAIIHARAGSSNNMVESESRVLPQPLPHGVADALKGMMD